MTIMTSTQIGAIAENIVSNQLIIVTDGRFSPFRPVADDDGIDLLVYDKKSGLTLPLQVKARTSTSNLSGGRDRGNNVHFEVRKSVVTKERGAWILGVLLNKEMSGVDRAWLFPMKDIPAIAGNRGDKYVVRPSKLLTTTDKFKLYQCEDMLEVTKRIVGLLEI